MAVSIFMLSRDPRAADPASPTAQRLDGYRRAGAEIQVVYFSVPRFFLVLLRGLRFVKRGSVVTSQDPFESGFTAWLIARLRGAALEVQMHGDFFGPYWRQEAWHRPLRLRLARFVVRRADQVRVVSERQARSIGQYVRSARIVVIPVSPRTIVRGPVTRPTISFAGRFSKEKNLPVLIAAFREVHKKYPEAILELRGAGEAQEELKGLQRLFEKETGAIDHIQFAAWQDGYSHMAASVCVLPSRHESWGRFVVEAALAGCPVVMTDVGCAGELIVDGESGWVVPVDDAPALAEALIEVLAGPEEASRRAANAQARVRQLPSAEATARLVVEAWQHASERVVRV